MTATPGTPTWALLARPEAFPEEPTPTRVEWVQTHLSHVYLTTSHVYKFRKPVDLGFVCFSSRAERNRDCVREVALNRRLAPDVYLGLAPLLGPPDNPCIGRWNETLRGDDLEHCVAMRRLPAGGDALSRLQRGTLGAREIDALAERLAAFHRGNGLGRPAPFAPAEWLAHCTDAAEDNFAALAEVEVTIAPRDLVARARDGARAFVAGHAERFERRRAEGRAVDGHGDLRLEHVWFESPEAPPLVIDCVEFSEPFRRIDAASEIAFAAMDLRYRGSPLDERLLRVYARESDDFDLYSVVDYFLAYRAAVRAKVAAVAARDTALPAAQRTRAGESALRHLTLAGDVLKESRRRGALILVCGVVGTGKSTVAAKLADLAGGVVVASDRVRKHLFAVAPTERLGGAWGTGAYAFEHTERTYTGLLERARPALASGRPVLLDATFARRIHRDAARALARELRVSALLVEAQCAPGVARNRLARRAAAGSDPSDAGPHAYAPSVRAFEAPAEWPEEKRVRIATDEPAWEERLAALAASLRASD